MKRNMMFVLLSALVVLLGSCGKQSSMDEATERALVEKYGEPVEVSVAEPGTLGAELAELKDPVFLRIFGKLNGTDLAALNSSECREGVKVLDLLDADFVAGGKPYASTALSGDSLSLTADHVAGSRMFFNMNVVEQLFLPLTLTRAEADAFDGLYQLTYVRLPETLTVIGDRAFYSCSKLATIDLPEGIDSLGASVFGESMTKLRIPRSVRHMSKERLGKFTDMYMAWTADEIAGFDSTNVEWIRMDSPTQGRTTFIFMRPTLHVPADAIAAYETAFRGYGKVVADNGDDTADAADAPDAGPQDGTAQPNPALMGRWSNNNDPVIEMVLAAEQGDHDGYEGMGYVQAANEYFEYDLVLVIKSITPEGDNLRLTYDKMEQTYADPDDPEGEPGGSRKVGEGQLTVVVSGPGKCKLESTEKRLNGVTLTKAQ